MAADDLIYFDHNATTPLDPRVCDAMLPWLGGLHGNPSSAHAGGSPRLPHTSHVACLGVSGHELMLRLDREGFAVSTGSACHSGLPQPSAAVVATGVPAAEAHASLRISFGMTNTAEEVEAFLAALAVAVGELRAAPDRRSAGRAVAV